MEFWGIDRSRVSLRLKALERLGKMETEKPSGELQRLAEVLASPKSKNAHKLPMNNKEFEILLVLAKNTAAASGNERSVLADQLGTYLVEFLDTKIATRPGLYETAPWQMATRELTKALLLVGTPDVFRNYMARAEKLWKANLSNDGLVSFAFSLRGFFEGLAEGQLNIEVATMVFEWTRDFLNTDFMSSLHGSLLAAESHFNKDNISINLEILRLFSTDTLLFPGPTQLSMSIAGFIRSTTRMICGVNSNILSVILACQNYKSGGPAAPELQSDLLADLAAYAANQVKIIEGSYQFRIQELPHLVPLSARSMWYYFEPIGAGVFYQQFSPEIAAAITCSVMELDQVDSRDDALLNLIRLAMVIWADSEADIVQFTKSLPGYLGAVSPESATQIGTIFANGISTQPQSLLVSSIYTLVNSLNIDEYMLRKRQYELSVSSNSVLNNSASSSTKKLDKASAEEPFSKFSGSILHTVVSMVVAYNDPQVYALAITVLNQKYNSVSTSFDIQVLMVLPLLAPFTTGREFDAIMNFLDYAERDAFEKEKEPIIHTVETVRVKIAKELKDKDSETRVAYLNHLLTLIVSKGDTAGVPASRSDRKTHTNDLSKAATEATLLFSPVANLLPGIREKPLVITDRAVVNKFRDAWLNLAVLGFSHQTEWTSTQHDDLLVISRSTPPLVMESNTNQVDSDLDLNPVLRRGSNQTNVHAQRKVIGRFLNREVRNMSYLRLMFISATIFLESFRAQTGLISHLPQYFGDPDFRDGDGNREMHKICSDCVMGYIKTVTTRRPGHPELDLDVIADQLRDILVLCCHRVDAIRRAALDIANALIAQVPSALCHRTSLFALLDLLTLMWQSCVDAEEDEYEPRSTFRSSRSNVEIHLNDYYDMRRHALKQLLSSARTWSKVVLGIMPDDFKSILAFYLDNIETDSDSSDVFDSVALGRSFALELGGIIPNSSNILPTSHRGFTSNNPDNLADGTSGFLSQYLSLSEYKARTGYPENDGVRAQLIDDYNKLTTCRKPRASDLTPKQLRSLYSTSARFVSGYNPMGLFVAKNAVHVPFRFFDGRLMKVAISFWSWIFTETPELRMPIMQEVADHWARSIDRKIGLFDRSLDVQDPMFAEMHYAPTDKKEIDRNVKQIEQLYAAHSHLICFLKSGFHASVQLRGTEYIDLFARMMHVAMDGLANWGSLHPLARTYRMELISIGLDVYTQYRRYRSREAKILQESIISAALSWYKQNAKWSFGGNLIQQRKDMALLKSLISRISTLFKANTPHQVAILLYLLEEELNRLEVWYDPLGKSGSAGLIVTAEIVDIAWSVDPEIAVYLFDRNYDTQALQTIIHHVVREPLKVIRVPKALPFFLQAPERAEGRFILYWAQSSPLQSINLFGSPKSSNTPYVLQYAMRSLESHPITTCFFYVPQIVQLLRHDEEGYVEEYILEAAKFSQLFAHQIIWNILANSYRDDDSTVPDPMKPSLDRVIEQMKDSFTNEERAFYDREFGFFNEVTDISGKLKPYIKKSKAEKKAKIDEEMAVIEVPEGVYLPSHPLGTVTDIDRDSGRPLQSHAKAPFLAKFKIRHEDVEYDQKGQSKTVIVDSWQGAIFKVGDDCRQDVLAIQIISVFRSIFNASGLDTFVFPYKVTATAPGCGVIDVLPNSISRDMLGREAVNGLYEWFITKYGGEDSIAFQRARNNFVKSMAAYSIISYLLQFKDRHNGNIMYDDDGHIIHIDFGFCFEICPGGVKFEAAPFKLTKEMIAVMGGSQNTQAYKWFEELCVKAFLSCRMYCEDICQMVVPMLESGLPCFKGETIKKLRARFVLQKNEREAAQYVRGLIRKSYESTFTTVYDEFQRITNGIPY